jgi:CheY-like chemotaxis protein
MKSNKIRVIIVDDEPEILDLMQNLLEVHTHKNIS